MSQKKKSQRENLQREKSLSGKIVTLPNEDVLLEERPRVRFRRALFSFFVMIVILIVVYFWLPISRLGVIYFDGRNVLTRSELISLIEIDEDEVFLSIRMHDIQSNIESHAIVHEAKVTRVWPNHIRIKLIEYEVAACALIEGEIFHILTDGVIHHENDGMRANCDEMMIHGLTQSEVDAGVPTLFVRQFVRIEPEIRDLIQMIEHEPLYGDIHRFSLSLIDGNTVKVTSHTMPDYLNLYRELLSNIEANFEPGLTGIFHLDVGNTFELHD